MTTTTKTISIEPSPAGYARMAQVFAECKAGAETEIAMAESLMDRIDDAKDGGTGIGYVNGRVSFDPYSADGKLVERALGALIEQEHRRVLSMEDGIAEIEKGALVEGPPRKEDP